MTIMQSHPVSLVGPVMIVAESAAGHTFEVPSNNVAVFAGPDTAPVTSWQVDIADPSILRFVPGEVFDTWRANPSFHPLREGTTRVTVSSPASAQSYTFSVTVTAPIDLGPLKLPVLEPVELLPSMMPPIMIEASKFEPGDRYYLPLGTVAVFVGPEGTSVSSWQASISDPSVAAFTPGHVYDTFSTNPGLRPLSKGSAEVTISSTEAAESYTFTLIVYHLIYPGIPFIDADSQDSASPAQRVGPIMIPAGECAGRTYQLPLSNVAVLCGYDPIPPSSWRAEIADPAVAEFVPGQANGSLTNPGFTPLCPGTTEVTLTSPDWPTELKFTLVVGEPYYPGAPTIIDAASGVAGTYQVGSNTVAVFNGPQDVSVTSWQASIADPSVVEFIPGSRHGTWTANPSFRPLRVGSTEITLSSRQSATTYRFTLSVVSHLGAADADAASADTAGAQVLPPIMIELNECFGRTYQVPFGRAAVFQAGNAVPVTWWRADIDDPTIVSYVPGRLELSATYSPGFRPLRPGSTRVRMTNPFLNGIWDFTVEVPPLRG